MSLVITPATRIGELLDAYPELEGELIAFAPAFGKLRNPILRRTLARVATLRAAAETANVDVAELIRVLRSRVGQQAEPAATPAGQQADRPAIQQAGQPADQQPGRAATPAPRPAASPRPDWIRSLTVAETLDVDQLLGQGRHPLGVVKKRLGEIADSQMIRLISGFKPQPLLEALAADQVRVHAGSLEDGRWEILIARGQSGREFT